MDLPVSPSRAGERTRSASSCERGRSRAPLPLPLRRLRQPHRHLPLFPPQLPSAFLLMRYPPSPLFLYVARALDVSLYDGLRRLRFAIIQLNHRHAHYHRRVFWSRDASTSFWSIFAWLRLSQLAAGGAFRQGKTTQGRAERRHDRGKEARRSGLCCCSARQTQPFPHHLTPFLTSRDGPLASPLGKGSYFSQP